jgi:hypothetical protein
LQRRLLIALVCALAFAPAAHASRTMFVGAAEDAGRGDPSWAKGKMDLAAAAGFTAIRMTSIWAPGQTAPSGGELFALRGAAQAADLDGIRVEPGGKHAGRPRPHKKLRKGKKGRKGKRRDLPPEELDEISDAPDFPVAGAARR